MWDRRFREERSAFLRDMAYDMSEERSSPVVGRITQLTEKLHISVDVIGDRPRIVRGLGGTSIRLALMHRLYVYRTNGRATMILTRVDPFHPEIMRLTDLEMQMIMNWAGRMVIDGIGRFIPADAGWIWWRK